MSLQTLLLLLIAGLIIYLNIATDERLEFEIQSKFGIDCNLDQLCGDIAEISCGYESKNIFYADKNSLLVSQSCSPECSQGNEIPNCEFCPPRNFDCESKWFPKTYN